MKAIYVIISIAALALLAPVASAVIINVPGDYPTIQEGIDAAQNGDTVLVAPGIYVETFSIENKNILVTSAEGPDNTEIIGFLILGVGLDTTFILRGFTVTADIEHDLYRSKALVDIDEGFPVIEGNIIEENGRSYDPATSGIRLSDSNAIIRGNIIRNNFSQVAGGGIWCGYGSPIIEGNIIANNSAVSPFHGAWGGGIFMASSGIVRYNLINDNASLSRYPDVRGGGISGGSRIYNNTIASNIAGLGPTHGRGGGFFFTPVGGQEEYYKNNIIAFSQFGGGVFATFPDSVEVDWDYNLVFGNDSANYIGIEPGPHDIQADPLFVDRFSGDYRLLPNSPCIDAGDPDFPLDPDGSRADIGAYYFDQTVGIDDPDESSGPYRFQLHQNYPNPFNAQTIISYTLSESSAVSLMIFSITGHIVKSIINKEVQSPGEHRYIWDGTDMKGQRVSTGIYFYELYVNDYRESKAMIMIK